MCICILSCMCLQSNIFRREAGKNICQCLQVDVQTQFTGLQYLANFVAIYLKILPTICQSLQDEASRHFTVLLTDILQASYLPFWTLQWLISTSICFRKLFGSKIWQPWVIFLPWYLGFLLSVLFVNATGILQGHPVSLLCKCGQQGNCLDKL